MSWFLFLTNLVLSTWDAYVAGRVWGEVSGWMKLIAWCAIIMSACGYLEMTAVVYGFAALSMHWINAQSIPSLIYLTIVPVLGTGLLIIIQTWIEAYKRRVFGSSGWNTFARVNNAHDALDGGISSSAFSSVWEFFKPDKDDDWKSNCGKAGILLVLLVAMAGALTYIFFQMGRRRSCYMRTGPEWVYSG